MVAHLSTLLPDLLFYLLTCTLFVYVRTGCRSVCRCDWQTLGFQQEIRTRFPPSIRSGEQASFIVYAYNSTLWYKIKRSESLHLTFHFSLIFYHDIYFRICPNFVKIFKWWFYFQFFSFSQGGVISGKYGSLLDFGFVGKFSNRQTYVISPDSKIEYVFTDVEGKVATHAEDVLAKIATL